MNEETLNKPISLQNLSLALAKVKADYWGQFYQVADSLDYLESETINRVPYPSDSGTTGQVLSLGSNGDIVWVTPATTQPITYSLSISSNVITLTGSDGSTSSVTLPVYNGGVS